MSAVPPIHHFLAGEDQSAAMFNSIKANIDFLRNPPMVHVARVASQTLAANWALVSFDTVLNSYDPYQMFNVSQPTVVTARVPGWYTVEGQFSLTATGTDERLILGIYKNGSTTAELHFRSDVQNSPSSGNANWSKEFMLFLNEGDWLHLGVWFDVDATRTTGTSSPSDVCRLRARWVSS